MKLTNILKEIIINKPIPKFRNNKEFYNYLINNKEFQHRIIDNFFSTDKNEDEYIMSLKTNEPLYEESWENIVILDNEEGELDLSINKPEGRFIKEDGNYILNMGSNIIYCSLY